MQLTKFTDYALRVLILLAHEPRSTIREIADTYRISENHLMKIVHTLGKAGYVETIRGKGGGLKLARSAERINIGDVVRTTEETLYAVECLSGNYSGDCRLARACKLKSILRDAQNAFMRELDQYTLHDLIAKRSLFAPIEFHRKARAQAA